MGSAAGESIWDDRGALTGVECESEISLLPWVVSLRKAGLTGILLAVLACSLRADEGHHHALSDEEIGSVHFTTSCSNGVEAAFNHAVALLHSFQYEEARTAFDTVATQDPTCAMARWGVAMSHYHGLWQNGDLAAGRLALRKAQEIAAENKKTTPRELGYITALAEIYQEDGKNVSAHDQDYERKMAAMSEAYPDDVEAAIFYALTLGITAPKSDKTFANQRKCGEILEPLLASHPHHPGVAHYLIHCYDNPVLAEQGLAAARLYAKIAPASAHANHMPSHIFTRLGLWRESIASNLKSADLAAQAEATSNNGEARDQRLHAMDYLEYAYLQSGQVSQAKAVLDGMNSLKPVAGLTITGDYALAAIPARLALELGKWEQASSLPAPSQGVSWAQAITWTAIGVGSARSKNVTRAAEAEHALASIRDAVAKQNNQYWSDQVEVERREVAAWIQQQSGVFDVAIGTMRSAAELEESMDKSPVTPGPILPAREMLAQLLALANRSQEAQTEFEAVLKVAPNRFNALYGAATAAEASGNQEAAQRYFRKLTEVSAGDERPELVAARRKLVSIAQKKTGGEGTVLD